MKTISEKIKKLRTNAGLSQKELANQLKQTSQSSINRYEHDEAMTPPEILLQYADFFDVSLDYIFGRTDKPQGTLYKYEPEVLKDKFKNRSEWEDFVTRCFAPDSPFNEKLKEALLNMLFEGDHN